MCPPGREIVTTENPTGPTGCISIYVVGNLRVEVLGGILMALTPTTSCRSTHASWPAEINGGKYRKLVSRG